MNKYFYIYSIEEELKIIPKFGYFSLKNRKTIDIYRFLFRHE